jgi:glycosyltransferase involved in cell wall biosynthesis
MSVQPATDAPRVSVVVPTHDRRDVLPEALDSVLAQEGVSLELIVVDDGSTDATDAMLRERYGAESRLRVVRQPQAGPSAARNRGVAEARGAFVAFLDSDDRFLPGNLAGQVAALEANPSADLAVCDVRFAGDWRRRAGMTMFGREGWIPPTSLEAMGRGASAAPSSMVLRLEAARALPFDEGLVWFEDVDFLFRFHLAGRALLLNRDVLAEWRHIEHAGAPRLSSDAPDRALAARIHVMERYLSRAPDPRSAALFLHRLKAKDLARRGLWRAARPHLWAVWRRRPLELHTLRKLVRSLLAARAREGGESGPEDRPG